MSKINIYRNLFLEKEELNRLIEFASMSVAVEAILSASSSFGLVSPGGQAGTPFRCSVSTVLDTVNITGGYVIGESLKPYKVPNILNYRIPADGKWYWLRVGPVLDDQLKNAEPGTVTVDAYGNLSGTVNFSGLVRGQSSGVPTCIRFVKLNDKGEIIEPLNNHVYQVVDIVDSTNLVLSSGYQFQPESQLKVIILGSVPMGRRFTDEHLKNGLYTYDNYNFELIVENQAGSIPPKDDPNQFYIARVQNNGNGLILILDERTEFWNLSGGSTPEPTYTVTIVPTPSDARVTIDGAVTNSVVGINGRTISYSVSKSGYVTKTGSYTIAGSDKVIYVTLELDPHPSEKVNLTVRTDRLDTVQGAVSINNETVDKSQQSIEVNSGTIVTIRAKAADGFMFSGWTGNSAVIGELAQQDIVVNQDMTLIARFESDLPADYVDFECKLENPTGGNTHEVLTVPVKVGTGEYEGVMVKS